MLHGQHRADAVTKALLIVLPELAVRKNRRHDVGPGSWPLKWFFSMLFIMKKSCGTWLRGAFLCGFGTIINFFISFTMV